MSGSLKNLPPKNLKLTGVANVKVLIAEDEPQVAQQLAEHLTEDGYQVDVTGNGEDAQRMAERNDYDAFLCDAMLPGRDGFNVVRHLRRKNISTPTIIVTARTDVKERVRALDLGADDYLIKPFAYVELLARLRALLRRAVKNRPTVIRVADLELDLMTREARRGGETIHLTTREFELLQYLMNSSPRAVTKSAIIEYVWNEDFDPDTNVVNVYVNYLRRKIERPGLKPLIHTVRSMGFALREEAGEDAIEDSPKAVDAAPAPETVASSHQTSHSIAPSVIYPEESAEAVSATDSASPVPSAS